ncbi:11460_t:CDS:2 [Paraglomus brasilianum]|uniref:Riboflavin kinase n=1 Tax=Paraglomus brasilianum TaxID=144538 RepID=A0A9N9G599_9GLOM|nr:11460_t:CDS:2 [Paraglomus brasilianum]
MTDQDSGRPLIVGSDAPESPYPITMKGAVVQGFGRGSKELGIPTANFPETTMEELCKDLDTGIYYGWAQIAVDKTVYPMVMSLGWNPYYKNEKRSAEVHIINTFSSDFYGVELRVIVLGFIRPEKDYSSVDALIKDIHIDIEAAKRSLQREAYLTFKDNDFFEK